MLKIIAGVALLLGIAFIGYRRSFTQLRLPLGARFVFLTGIEYIFVGFALGGQMIGVLDLDTVRSLTPIFGLGLGLIGLMVGIQLEVAKLRRFPGWYLRVASVQALVTMAIVYVPCRALLAHLFPDRTEEVVVGSLVLAATASCTAPTALALIEREFRVRGGRALEMLRYVSSLDSVAALAAFGLAYCRLRAPAGGALVGAFDALILSLAVGVALGFLLHILTQVRCREEELVLFVTGTVLFAGGLAAYLRLSPLFVSMIVGVVATNLPGSKQRILNLLGRLEKPFYVIFLVLAGAIWQPGSQLALPLAGLFVALRIAGKTAGGALGARSAGRSRGVPRALGLGLVPQGGVVIAMIMSYHHLGRSVVASIVVTAVLIGVIVSELIGPWLAVTLLRRQGEIGS